ncbi:Ig-like domain-containing protein [Massilia sp. NR 4-1]|uniref:Ig-like domain-containing protein n=1 Tax=Massilia sp. NR 4-1 TaxID=1678028 RepID=UPI0009E5213A|nr:Ig-like domain-containing protein [Massilia sp. NR 4-1]
MPQQVLLNTLPRAVLHAAPQPAPATLYMLEASDTGVKGDGRTADSSPALAGQGIAGATIKIYFDGKAEAFAQTTVAADGKWEFNENTEYGEGPHTVVVTQTTAHGTSLPSEALSFVIDTQAPQAPTLTLALSSDSVIPGDNKTSVSELVLTGKGEPHATLAIGFGPNYKEADFRYTTVDADGNWSLKLPKLEKGTYTFLAAQQDSADNISKPSAELTVTIGDEPAPPTGLGLPHKDDSGEYGDGLTKDENPSIEGQGSAGNTVVLYNKANLSEMGRVVVDAEGHWNIKLDDLADQTYTVFAREISPQGLPSEASADFTFTVDTITPPQVDAPKLAAISDSGEAGDNITSAKVLTLSGKGEAGALVDIFVDGAKDYSDTAYVDKDGNWSIQLKGEFAPGQHSFVARQADLADNVGGMSSALNVVVLGELALDAASDSGRKGDNITAHTTPAFQGTGGAGNQMALFDGSTQLGTATIAADGSWRISSAQLAEGVHTLQAKQSADGKVISSQQISVTIDSKAPTKLSLSSTTINGGAGDNAVVGTVRGEDAGGGALTYRLASHADQFKLDGDALYAINPKKLSSGTLVLQIEATDAAGNTFKQDVTLLVKGADPVAPPRPAPDPVVDGVSVATASVGIPGVGSGTEVRIPIVTSGRSDSTGASATADIPLVSSGGQATLTAHVPVGLGLSATGAGSQAAGQSLEHLIAAIKAVTPQHAAAEQGYLTKNGLHYLQAVEPAANLQVQRIALSGTDSQPAGVLTLSGSPDAKQQTALVIDTQQLQQGASLALQNVSFAAIVGKGQVSADTSGQVLTGDGASQHFTVSSSAGGKVFAGGGNDVLQFGSAAKPGSQAAAPASQTPVATLLDGGQGQDSASFLGRQADYQITRHDGYVTVASLAKPNEVATIVNVEKLQFSDGALNLEARNELTSLAALYQNVLGRQADAQGFSFWGQAQSMGVSMGRIAYDIIRSEEGQKNGFAFHGDAKQDLTTLYQAIFERAPDEGGFAFWLQAMQNGVSLEQVADGFLHSVEMVGFNKAQGSWDFSF